MDNSRRKLARSLALLAAGISVLVIAAPAAAHHLVVTPPGKDGPVFGPFGHWVGGDALPPSASGEGLHLGGPPESPALFPAAHSAGPGNDKGLVQACEAAKANASTVVAFVPPPSLFPNAPADTDCKHGEP